MPGELKLLQALRGIAVTLVVLFHAFLVAKKYLGESNGLSDAFVFGQIGVDLFFVISGFVMVFTTRGSHQQFAQITHFLFRRLVRIYPPFWFFCSIVLMVHIFYPGMVNSSQGGKVDILRSFLLLPSSTLPLVQVAWSLILELWFYAVFALLLWLPKRWLAMSLIGWAAIVVATNVLQVVPAGPWFNVMFHAAAIQYVMGGLACLVFLRQRGGGFGVVVAGFLLLAIAVFSAPLGYMDVIASMNLQRSILFGLAFSIVILGAAQMERVSRLGVPQFIVNIGNWSYSIYLSHVLVLSAAGRLYAKLLGVEAGLLTSIVFMIVCVTISNIVGYVSYSFIEHPLLETIRMQSLNARNRKRLDQGAS